MIREIHREDCHKKFRTGNEAFDKDKKKKVLTLDDYYKRYKQGYYDEVWVFDVNGRIAGILCLTIKEEDLWINRAGVDEDFQGNLKYLAALYSKAEQRARSLGKDFLKAKIVERVFKTLEKKIPSSKVEREGSEKPWGKFYVVRWEIVRYDHV